MELVFCGPDDDVTAAMDKTVLLVSRCRATTSVKSIPCPDNRVFNEVVKRLPMLNKSPAAHVSAVDGVVGVTGNDEEQATVCKKLVKLGLVVEDPPAHSTGVVTALDVSQPPPPPSEEVAQPRTGLPEASRLMEVPGPVSGVEPGPPVHALSTAGGEAVTEDHRAAGKNATGTLSTLRNFSVQFPCTGMLHLELHKKYGSISENICNSSIYRYGLK